MRYSEEKIDSIGFQFKGEEIILFMAGVRKYDDSVIMFKIPERMKTKKEYLDEICEFAAGMTYDEVIEEIEKKRESEEECNVMWKANGKVIFTYYEPKKVSYRE